MRDLVVWRLLRKAIESGESAVLMVVVESIGSSPGRVGFKMAVTPDGQMAGSIGGGIMEHKLVEMALDRLRSGLPLWEVKRQIHSKEAPTDQSGMICSGEQTVAMLRLEPGHSNSVHDAIAFLESGKPFCLSLSESRLGIHTHDGASGQQRFEAMSQDSWIYEEVAGQPSIAHVVGAGHVGLELCKVLSGLDFLVINYDDRPGLNTLEANDFAHRKIVIDYNTIGESIPSGPDQYIVLVTFGYRTDEIALRTLIGREFTYLGMMGSEAKVAKMMASLRAEGVDEAWLRSIKSPAGLIPHCKTPAEIAISIAAEMIAVRNRKIANMPP
ncbi:MAG: XdhC family protein [Bacteroidia bacterium]